MKLWAVCCAVSLLAVGMAMAGITVGAGLARDSGAQESVSPAVHPVDAAQGDVEKGATLYKKYGCYQCHGLEGQGSPRTGPRLGPDPIAFPLFVRFTREPRDRMPPYTSKVLTDQEMADIYAFVESLPRPPAVESIPLLSEVP